ncbi:MAG: hypothetical protein AB4058_20670 [Microcystaceae cyanobacterium]
MQKLTAFLTLSSLLLSLPQISLAEPPKISTVATDLLDLSPQQCLENAEKTIQKSPMAVTTKGEDFVAGTWEDYKGMILCRATSTNQIVVVFMVAGQGSEQVELIAAKLADIFRNQ